MARAQYFILGEGATQFGRRRNSVMPTVVPMLPRINMSPSSSRNSVDALFRASSSTQTLRRLLPAWCELA